MRKRRRALKTWCREHQVRLQPESLCGIPRCRLWLEETIKDEVITIVAMAKEEKKGRKLVIVCCTDSSIAKIIRMNGFSRTC